MTVVTRFAPSPTGYLHIGGARTALFNLLFARHHNGKFLLRIEDTDRARSTQEAVDAILDGLTWLDITWDEEPIYQSRRLECHAEVAYQLLEQGRAYRCYCTAEELQGMRERALKEGRSPRYEGRCRALSPAADASDRPHTIRLKANQEGATILHDHVQGDVTVSNAEMDDFILLRSDGTPTYMLSVVVDDHDMAITHIIRGDDHLTNAFRQMQIYQAMNWTTPDFAHPLIHGPDGAKLSKRHGALGVDAYRDMGLLPEALTNYLLRLGWSHGDDEIMTREQAIAWFDLDGIGKSPARLDMAKLINLNAHYLRASDDGRLADLIREPLQQRLGIALDEAGYQRLLHGMTGLKQRAKTLHDLADSALFYVAPRPLPLDARASALLDKDALKPLKDFSAMLESLEPWRHTALEDAGRRYAEETGLKLGQLAQPLRAALTGQTVSPGIFEVMEILGKEETLARLGDVLEVRDN